MDTRPDSMDLPPGEHTIELNALLTRTLVRAAQGTAPAGRAALSPAVAGGFSWPSPPYMEFIEEAGRQDPETCVLVFKDDTRATGILVEFLPDQELLKFQPSGATASISVAFSLLISLQLLLPMRLRRQGLPPEIVQADLIAPLERQPFSIDLVNGTKLQGETMGVVNAMCGIFL
jgi:hypothetical protein